MTCKTRRTSPVAPWPILSLALLANCVPRGETPDRGAIEITVSGDESVVHGIPATAFADGWSITFDRFLVYVDGFLTGGYSLYDGDASISFDDGCDFPFEERGPHLLNLQRPWTVLLRAVEAQRCRILFYWHTAYKDEPFTAGAPGVTQEDFDLLRLHFASVQIDALAQRGAVSKRISLTFRFAERSLLGIYSCLEEIDGGILEGVVVPSGDKISANIVLRAEQLFRTELAVGAGSLRFDAWARADDISNRDGTITFEELKGVTLSTIDPADGTYSDTRYGAKSLAEFVAFQSRFFWQFGERGLCKLLPER